MCSNIYNMTKLSKHADKKKYRHAIEVEKEAKKKIKKSDLLKRIEHLEQKITLLVNHESQPQTVSQ